VSLSQQRGGIWHRKGVPGNTPLAHGEIPMFQDVKDPLQVWEPPFGAL
jgi:hypothetical protein